MAATITKLGFSVPMDVLLAGIGFLLGVLVPHAVLRWDERGLPQKMHDRAWNSASRWAAIVGFSFLCIPVHFAKTRRTVVGAALGVGWMLLALIATSLVVEGFAWLFDG